jgi:hypothetical protein
VLPPVAVDIEVDGPVEEEAPTATQLDAEEQEMLLSA